MADHGRRIRDDLGNFPRYNSSWARQRLVAPRRLLIGDDFSAQDRNLKRNEIQEAYALPKWIYQLYKADRKRTVTEDPRLDEIALSLTRPE